MKQSAENLIKELNEGIKLVEERAEWEIPVSKPTENFLIALTDVRNGWMDYMARITAADAPPLTLEEEIKILKKLGIGAHKIHQRNKAFLRHIKDHPIDYEKVLAKMRARNEYMEARVARLEKENALREEISAKVDIVKQEMQEELLKWKEENANGTITPEMEAYRDRKIKEFDRRLRALSSEYKNI